MHKEKKPINFTYILLLLIIGAGFFIRCIGLNKPEGMWFDELYCFKEAKQSFPTGILKILISEETHVPLYYFILHFWMNLFGTSDIAIRLLSVLFGVLTIPVAYLSGKELKSKQLGLWAAGFVAVNSFLIYYSQEIKHYSMQSFLGILSIYFLLKIKNNPDNKYLYLWLAITNLCIMYTYPFGIVFIFFEALFFLIYLFFKQKNKLKYWIKINTLFVFIGYIPFLILFFYQNAKFFKSPVSLYEFWPKGIKTIVFLVVDYLTPLVLGIEYNFSAIANNLLGDHTNIVIIYVAISPIIIGLLGIYMAVIKTRNFAVLLIFGIAISFIGFETILMFFDKFSVVPRYTSIIAPLFLLVIVYGVLSIKNKKISNALLISYISLNLFFLLVSPVSAPKLGRPSGSLAVANILNEYEFTDKDIIFMGWGGVLIDKYYPPEKGRIINFGFWEAFLVWKKEYVSKIIDKNLLDKINKKNIRSILNDYISSPYPSNAVQNFFRQEIDDKLESNRYFIIVTYKPFNQYNSEYLSQYALSPSLSYSDPLALVLSSKLLNDLEYIARLNYTLIDTIDRGPWLISIYEKSVKQ